MDTIEAAQQRLTDALYGARTNRHPLMSKYEASMQEKCDALRHLIKVCRYHGVDSETLMWIDECPHVYAYIGSIEAPETVIRFGFTKMDSVFFGFETAAVQYFDRGPVGDTPNGWVYIAVPHGDISDTLGEIDEAGGILL